MKAEVALQVLSTRISVDRIGSSQKPRNKHSKARSSEAVLVPGGASRRALVRGERLRPLIVWPEDSGHQVLFGRRSRNSGEGPVQLSELQRKRVTGRVPNQSERM